MSDLSISRQKAAKIIFPSHPDPSPPPYLRDGELMRFLFFYFFLCPSSSREEEGEREEGSNPGTSPNRIILPGRYQQKLIGRIIQVLLGENVWVGIFLPGRINLRE